MEEDKKLTDLEELKKYMQEEVEKINRALGVNSIDDGLKKLEEMEKDKNSLNI